MNPPALAEMQGRAGFLFVGHAALTLWQRHWQHMRLPSAIVLALVLSCSAGASKFPNCAGAEKEFTSSDSGVVLFIGRDVKSNNNVGPFSSVFKQVQDRLAAQGTQLVLLISPLRAMAFTPEQSGLSTQEVENARAMYSGYLASIRAVGLQVVDLSDLSGFKSEINGFFLKGDHHWSPEGARYAAQVTAATLKLPVTEPVTFITTKGATIQVLGSYRDLLQQRCGYKTTQDQWETVQTYSTSDFEANLLGDESNDVVVVGDSFVAGPWNFTGFLEEALRRRVINASVSGGGMFTSIVRYLQSPPAEAPKVLIWEIFKGSLDNELRDGPQTTPRLQANTRLLLGSFDSCKSPGPVKVITDTKGGFVVPLSSQGNILKLVFSSNSVGDFTLKLNGAGKSTPMLVSRGFKTEVDKTFTFELTPDDLSGLTGVTVAGDTLNGAVSVSQCQ